MRTGNPALRTGVFSQAAGRAQKGAMSLQAVVDKSFILLGLVFLTSWLSWQNPSRFGPFMFFALIAGFILAMVIIFKKETARFIAPVYALTQGIFLGTLSAYFESYYPGIVIQAVALTMGTLLCLLFAYKTKLIKVSEKFRLGVVVATGAIALIYFISIIASFFGKSVPVIHQAGFLGIAFSLFVVVIAALNLVLDFDFIERGVESGAPKYLEWYAAFSLMVTLIWLYLEMLRLLAKLRSR